VWLLLLVMLNWKDFVTEPFEKQRPYIEDCINPEIQYVASFCGLQSGKTISEADGLYAALYGPKPIMLPAGPRGKTPMEAWLISKSYALAEVLLETFKWRTPPDIWATDRELRSWGLSKGDRYTHWLKPRSGIEDGAPVKLRVRTASDPDSLRATNNLGIAACDELPHWKEMSWNNLQGRGIVAKTKYLIAGTPRGKNFAYRQIAVPGGWGGGNKTDPKIAVHTWTSADNPYADKAHIERLRRIFGREYAKQELEALFTEQVGYVYGMFDRIEHMVKLPSDDPDFYPVRIGAIDPGLRDPYAGSILCRTPEGVWYQVWEFHETGSSSSRVAPMFKRMQDMWKVKTWYVDKRKPSDILDLRDAGVRAQANIDIHAEDDRRTIAPMVNVVRELLRAGRLFIGKEDEYTAEEFEKYHYPDEADEREKNTNDTPVDWMNHHMDAIRYGICSVEEIADAKPRYRQGADQKPREIGVRGQLVPVGKATMNDYIKAQDAKMDEAASRERQMTGRVIPNRNRIRTRGLS
jgi:hypothetical protein